MDRLEEDRRGGTLCLQVAMLLSALAILIGVPHLAFAQGGEVEFNHPCPAAQDFGAVTLPFTVEGSLDTPPDFPDVDFFRFTATPGAEVRADLIGLELGDPFLGLFDSGCQLLASNDDSGGLNSRLQFAIPDDGVFILAATSCCDGDFSGTGGSSGSYQLTITPLVLAGSISGRIVDAVSGTPLRGDAFPFAFVELRRCLDSDCLEFEFVNAQSTDREGRFLFSSDGAGFPLTADRYQVVAFADQFQTDQTAPFDVGEDEDHDIGDLPLTPFPIQFFAVDPCGNIAPTGGTCTYSVRVRNSSSTTFKGAAWSLISGFGIGSLANETVFQTGKRSGNPSPQKLALKPQQSTFLQFQFDVPGTVAEFASFCAEALVGQDPSPFFNTVGRRFLFCVSKEGGTFSVVPEKKARKLFRQFEGKR